MSEVSPKPVSWFKRNPKKTIVIFVSTTILFLLIAIEILLRGNGFVPGVVAEDYKQFEVVDSLYNRDAYGTDDKGIVTISRRARSQINGLTHLMVDSLDRARLHLMDMEFSVFSTIEAFYDLNYDPNASSELALEFRRISTLQEDSLTEFQKRLMTYVREPINGYRFKSISFDKFDSKKPKILLIGDSFTWGLSANPIHHSFYDNLLARGYLVYNTGVIAADPAQYEAIAKKYIPILQPDIVIVNYYMGNDHMHYSREVKAGEFIHHPSSAGWLNANPEGFYLPLEDIYEYIYAKSYIPYQDRSGFNRICGMTVLGTKFWSGLSKINLAYNFYNHHPEYQQKFDTITWTDPPISEKYIEGIGEKCSEHGAKFILSLIPECSKLGNETMEDARIVFGNRNFEICEKLLEKDYNCDDKDRHLNNEGAKKYADFIETLILQ